jgi:asparaginyl-tRNA synthetase
MREHVITPEPVRRTILAPRSWAVDRIHFEAALSHPWYHLVSNLFADLADMSVDFYRGRGYKPVLMPITCSSISSPMGLGSDSLPVEVELFGQKTFLADSLQFQLEFMLRHSYKGVYYIMPSFRGEACDATHLNQFFHSEAELCGGIDEVIEVASAYVKYLTAGLLKSDHLDAIEAVAGSVSHLVDLATAATVPQITHAEAIKMLSGIDGMTRELCADTCVLTRLGERRLIEYFGGFVWVTAQPALAVPFYQAKAGDGTSLTGDFLIGSGETIGAGERHTTGDQVRRALKAHEVDPESYEWYVDMKDRYPLRTAGFGMGIERFLMWVLQHDDIRDLQLFTRLTGYHGPESTPAEGARQYA